MTCAICGRKSKHGFHQSRWITHKRRLSSADLQNIALFLEGPRHDLKDFRQPESFDHCRSLAKAPVCGPRLLTAIGCIPPQQSAIAHYRRSRQTVCCNHHLASSSLAVVEAGHFDALCASYRPATPDLICPSMDLQEATKDNKARAPSEAGKCIISGQRSRYSRIGRHRQVICTHASLVAQLNTVKDGEHPETKHKHLARDARNNALHVSVALRVPRYMAESFCLDRNGRQERT